MGNFRGHATVTKPDGSGEHSWKSFTCGHCGRDGSAAVVAHHPIKGRGRQTLTVYHLACPTCGRGSVLNPLCGLSPGTRFGPLLEGLPDNVRDAYDEARDCMSVNAYTAAELVCRKILMHAAVDEGADEGESFASYIDYLSTQGYVTPPMKGWVDLIRQHGNESAHELTPPEKERAEGTVMFTAALLRMVYEMEHKTKRYAKTEDEGD